MYTGLNASNPKLCPLNDLLNDLLTRVKSRDASASKNTLLNGKRLLHRRQPKKAAMNIEYVLRICAGSEDVAGIFLIKLQICKARSHLA